MLILNFVYELNEILNKPANSLLNVDISRSYNSHTDNIGCWKSTEI